jgi:hypothetical protein
MKTSKGHERAKRVFLIEKAIAPNQERLAMIVMREDGRFEGRIHWKRDIGKSSNPILDGWSDDYEICAITETLPRVRTIVYEELGL